MSFGSSYFTVPKFTYIRPSSIDELLDFLSEHGQEAKVMSGGVGLLAFMKERLLRPKYVVSLSGINELKTLRLDDGGLSVGAGVHLSELETEAMKRAYPTLYFAVKSIADPIVRNMGTLAGDVLEALPWGDAYPALISLNARAEIMSRKSRREAPVNGIVTGFGQTAISEDEIVTRITVPQEEVKGTYVKFSNASEYGLATVALSYYPKRESFTMVIGSISESPVILTEKDVEWRFGEPLEQNASRLISYIDRNVSPMSDMLSSSEFRKHVVKVIALKAIKEVFRQ